MSQRQGMARARALGAILFVLLLGACGGGSERHALGESAVVGYNERTESGARGVSTSVEITVLDVRTGSHDDLTEAGFEVDPEDRNTTPYYVDARYENTGDEPVTRNLDVSLEDSDGNLIGTTLVFDYGDQGFPPCERVTEGDFAPGDSYESCTLFLVPEGVEVASVTFLSDKGADAEPEFVYWEVE